MNTVQFIFWILLCQVPGLVGRAVTQHHMPWYHQLNQPFFTPPDGAFPVVWGALYLCLGCAGYLISRPQLNAQNRKTLGLFVLQLALNTLWAPLFFGRQEMGGALLVLCAMIVLTGWIMRRVWQPARGAFWLLVPYLLWLLFAWGLSITLLLLN